MENGGNTQFARKSSIIPPSQIFLKLLFWVVFWPIVANCIRCGPWYSTVNSFCDRVIEFSCLRCKMFGSLGEFDVHFIRCTAVPGTFKVPTINSIIENIGT